MFYGFNVGLDGGGVPERRSLFHGGLEEGVKFNLEKNTWEGATPGHLKIIFSFLAKITLKSVAKQIRSTLLKKT